MNHDFEHGADYQEDKCPKDCFRGELIRDLAGYSLPVSWMSFKGTEECLLKEQANENTKRTL